MKEDKILLKSKSGKEYLLERGNLSDEQLKEIVEQLKESLERPGRDS